jgi:two-component system heavy metal sensor histidine kinase CusS
MRSIGVKLTGYYVLSATATLAILFAIGYQLLEARLTRGLDQLIETQFQRIKAALGPNLTNLSSRDLDERVRETSEYSAALFYVSIENPGTGIEFFSSNLHGQEIPDVKGERAFNAVIKGVGEVRVNEFLLPPIDISVATPMQPLHETMNAYVKVCAALLFVMMMISLVIGFGLSRMMLNPVRLMSDTAKRISSDNLSERIPVSNVRDEISDLARLLNQMFDRLEAAFEKVRRFSDEASHELKTPLSLVRLHAEKMLSDGELAPSQTEAVIVQIEELARLNQIIDGLLFLSRAEAAAIVFDLKLQNPSHLLDGFSQDALALTEHHGRRFMCRHWGSGEAAFEEKWLRQVLLNVLSNALNVSPPGGLITLNSKITNGLWSVSIEDEGPGLPLEQLKRMFERFVRFPVPFGSDKGSGLGLAICQSIIALHGGRIYAQPGSSGRGLQVTFELPAATPVKMYI